MNRFLWLLGILCMALSCPAQSEPESAEGLIVQHHRDSAQTILLPIGTPMRARTPDGKQQGKLSKVDSTSITIDSNKVVVIGNITKLRAYSVEIGQREGLGYGRRGIRVALLGLLFTLLGALLVIVLFPAVLVGAILLTYGLICIILGIAFWVVGTYNRVNLTPLGKTFHIGKEWRLKARVAPRKVPKR